MSDQQQATGWPPAITGSIITLLGVAIGLYVQSVQFNKKFEKELKDAEDLRNRELAQRAKEFKIKFYENQMTVYKELCHVVSKITMASRMKDADKDFGRLQELILGDLSVFADQEVQNATLRFNKYRVDLAKKNIQITPTEMQSYAFAVSNACRDSLMATFELIGYNRFGKGIGALVPEIPEPKRMP